MAFSHSSPMIESSISFRYNKCSYTEMHEESILLINMHRTVLKLMFVQFRACSLLTIESKVTDLEANPLLIATENWVKRGGW